MSPVPAKLSIHVNVFCNNNDNNKILKETERKEEGEEKNSVIPNVCY